MLVLFCLFGWSLTNACLVLFIWLEFNECLSCFVYSHL